jgi:PAS domain S-box-containing protein
MARKPTYEELEQRIKEFEKESAKGIRREEVLREEATMFRVAFEQAPVGICLVNPDGRFLNVNGKFCDMLGYSVSELLSRTFQDITHPDDLGSSIEWFRNSLAGETTIADLEKRYLHKEGHVVWGIVRGFLLRNVDGSARFFITHVQDITERKRAEEALRESEEKYKELYEEAPMGYMEYDNKGRITKVNRRELEMLGYTAEEVVGEPAWNFVMEKEKGQELIKAKLAGDKPPSKDLERTYIRKDGTTFPGLIQDAIFKDRSGRIMGIRSTILDITERKRAEKEREKLEAQLRQAQKMEAAGRLAGGVAHDFNNMLGIIIGNVELAKMEVEPSEPIHNELQEIQKAAQRSANIVRQLLAFARKQTVSPKVVDLNDAVSGMLKMLRRLIGEEIELAWIPGHDLWPVKIDPSQVDQILANLAVNARDAIAGVGKVTVETANAVFDESYCREHEEALPGKHVLLALSDTGSGMTPEIMEHLFDPFFTTKEVGKGTGLGLATVYGIVKQNKGFIYVYSELGKGTTFKIYLPKLEGEAVVAPEKTDEKKIPKGTETVLVAEDEGALLNLARAILTRQGYTVLTARTPSEALSLAEEHQGEIHLLLTDVVMPEMNGRELMEKLYAKRPNIKGLFMSGYTANVVAHHGVLDKGVHFIEKPFSPIALGEKVREVLDKA